MEYNPLYDNLHSNMFLLRPGSVQSAGADWLNLHSNMFLLRLLAGFDSGRF